MIVIRTFKNELENYINVEQFDDIINYDFSDNILDFDYRENNKIYNHSIIIPVNHAKDGNKIKFQIKYKNDIGSKITIIYEIIDFQI